jgi:uncharacterized RDD family membrane protein YckC
MAVAQAIQCPGCGSEALDNAGYCHRCGRGLMNASAMSDTTSLRLPRSEYAPIWRRLLACGIDWCLEGIVLVPSLLLLFWCIELITSYTKLMDIETGRFIAGMGAVLVVIITDWLYNAKMNSSERQATFGKEFMRLKVTGMRGERIGFGQASGRYFAKFLSTFALLIGFVIAPFTRRKQTLHDIVAGTLVLKA